MKKNEEEQSISENIREARNAEWIKKTFNLGTISNDHEHCMICWTPLNPAYMSEVFESSVGWLCDKCHKKHIVG